MSWCWTIERDTMIIFFQSSQRFSFLEWIPSWSVRINSEFCIVIGIVSVTILLQLKWRVFTIIIMNKIIKAVEAVLIIHMFAVESHTHLSFLKLKLYKIHHIAHFLWAFTIHFGICNVAGNNFKCIACSISVVVLKPFQIKFIPNCIHIGTKSVFGIVHIVDFVFGKHFISTRYELAYIAWFFAILLFLNINLYINISSQFSCVNLQCTTFLRFANEVFTKLFTSCIEESFTKGFH